MSLSQTMPPDADPVSLAEVKAHLRIDHTDEDTLLASYIKAAVSTAELILKRQLITAKWTQTFDSFPTSGILRLARPPLQSVEEITYIDPQGQQQTLSWDLYSVDVLSQPGRVLLVPEQSWPDTRRQPDAVTIVFLAGYGDDPIHVPENYRLAMLYLVGHYYKLREPVITGTIVTAVPLTVESLLANRNYQFA